MLVKENEAVIITDPYNMRYFCGFSGGEGHLYMSAHRKAMLVDSRYGIWAANECADAEVIVIGRDGYYPELNRLIKEDNISKIMLEGDFLTINRYNRMRENLECDNFGIMGDELIRARMIKNETEIDNVRKAEQIGDKTFTYIVEYIKNNLHKEGGLTEKEVALEIEVYMRSHGAEALSFDVIAVSGLNSASPHAVPTDKVIEDGFLTLDFGCVYKGYCSDMTRTIMIGEPAMKHINIYDTVKKAQQAALDNIKAGMTGREADSIARGIIEQAGYGEYFTHSLGHGIGLYIHEMPTLSYRDETVLEPGMIVSVEPGIYIEGFGGVRIEDAVVIRKDGVLNLTRSPKELIVIR